MNANTRIDAQIQEDAMAHARNIRKAFARAFTDPNIYTPEANPVSVFMAGSPGAGKTEASIELVEKLAGSGVLRIDPDDFRGEFREYNGRNSELFQGAISTLVNRVLDNAFDNKQSFVLDGTLTNYGAAHKNIDRSVKKGRTVQILYVYQKPEIAWDFVQQREALDGRRINPQTFIDQYFAAREVVNRLKAEFGVRVKVDLLLKNIDNGNRFAWFGVDNIDPYIPEQYTREYLEQILITG